ncbi:MAG TPA: tRNA pseudouridine(38-40) synthase TruA [Anaeromyxobacteraceae bacterium]|nr:tRNA pseudouridine(38-40) synthase TruA [Anaeromyxobacteraceae bacterium]
MTKRRYALKLAYHGASFRGFQRQSGLLTVQGCLEEALAHLGLHPHTEAAARTDAGAHALGQVVTFAAEDSFEPKDLRRVVNAFSPPGLVCLEAACVSPSTHARASALSRTYVYLVGWPAPAELHGYAWSLPDRRAFPSLTTQSPDIARAREALRGTVGLHDFGGFARRGAQTARRKVTPGATVRRLLRVEVIEARQAPLAAFIFEGVGFLRAMVRHLVGQAISIAVGASAPETMTDILGAPERRYSGVRAPAWGLTLSHVSYKESLFTKGEADSGLAGARDSSGFLKLP